MVKRGVARKGILSGRLPILLLLATVMLSVFAATTQSNKVSAYTYPCEDNLTRITTDNPQIFADVCSNYYERNLDDDETGYPVSIIEEIIGQKNEETGQRENGALQENHNAAEKSNNYEMIMGDDGVFTFMPVYGWTSGLNIIGIYYYPNKVDGKFVKPTSMADPNIKTLDLMTIVSAEEGSTERVFEYVRDKNRPNEGEDLSSKPVYVNNLVPVLPADEARGTRSDLLFGGVSKTDSSLIYHDFRTIGYDNSITRYSDMNIQTIESHPVMIHMPRGYHFGMYVKNYQDYAARMFGEDFDPDSVPDDQKFEGRLHYVTMYSNRAFNNGSEENALGALSEEHVVCYMRQQLKDGNCEEWVEDEGWVKTKVENQYYSAVVQRDEQIVSDGQSQNTYFVGLEDWASRQRYKYKNDGRPSDDNESNYLREPYEHEGVTYEDYLFDADCNDLVFMLMGDIQIDFQSHEISKIWKDAGDVANRPTIEQYHGLVRLYEQLEGEDSWEDVTDEYASNLHISRDDDGSYTVRYSGLPLYRKVDDEAVDIYEYRICEMNGYGCIDSETSPQNIRINGNEYKVQYDNYGNITNTLVGNVTLKFNKTWNDYDPQYTRPDKFYVDVVRKSERPGANTETVLSNVGFDAMAGEFTFNQDFDKYDSEGYLYNYSIVEKQAGMQNYNIETTTNNGTIQLTNTLKTVNFAGTKTWKDDAKEDERPTIEQFKTKLKLYWKQGSAPQYGEAPDYLQDNISITETANPDAWAIQYSGLPACDKNGVAYSYSIREDRMQLSDDDWYTIEVIGANITNTLTGYVSIAGKKTWVNDTIAERPEAITVTLYRQTSANAQKTKVNAEAWLRKGVEGSENENIWEYQYAPLEKYDSEGREYIYSVTEKPIEGYETIQDGFNFTNKRLPIPEGDEPDEPTPEKPTPEKPTPETPTPEKPQTPAKPPVAEKNPETNVGGIMVSGVSILSIAGAALFAVRKFTKR